MIRSANAPLARDSKGSARLEFALVLPVLVVLLAGFFDFGHRLYANAILEGVMQKAARRATLESGSSAAASLALDALVEEEMKKVVGAGATFEPVRLAYHDFSDVGKMEVWTDESPENHRYDPGECFTDLNNNRVWDADIGAAGQGGARDAVLYKMSVTYSRLLPMGSLLGLPDEQVISASTVLRNQPFGDQADEAAPAQVECS